MSVGLATQNLRLARRQIFAAGHKLWSIMRAMKG